MDDAKPATPGQRTDSLAQNTSDSARRKVNDSLPADRILITRCQKGDIEAFNLLVQRYEKVVFNFAYRLCANYDDANDIAQDAFVRAFNAIGSFRGDAAFTTWLFRITTNVYLDEKKKQKAHPHTSLDEFIELEESSVGRQVEDPGPTPETIVADQDRSEIIARAISSLPDFQRAMIVLYHVNQKSYEEISELMKMPIGTVKSRLNRARISLKEKLSDVRELF